MSVSATEAWVDAHGFGTVDDEKICTVVDVLNQPAQKVFVIKSRDREILVPDVEAFIKSIDLENGIIVIDPIEGLLD